MSYQIEIDSVDEQIFQAAEHLLAEVGDGFTMAQLTDKAHVSRATIYRRVGNKESLLTHLAEVRGADIAAAPDIRTRILQGARQLFGRMGLLQATMEQIAEEAGVGVATVYRHFGDKESLLKAFIAEVSPSTAVATMAVHPTDDVAADLTAIANKILPFFYENRDILRLTFSGSLAEQAYLEQLRTGSDRSLHKLADYFRAQIEAGRINTAVDPQELSLALIGLFFAFALVGPIHYDVALDDPPRAAQFIVQLFLHGIPGTD